MATTGNTAQSATSATPAGGTSTAPTAKPPLTLDEINKKIAAAEKYKEKMQAAGKWKEFAGATSKLDEYYRQRNETKPPSLQSQLGIQETLDIQGEQNAYDAGAALRSFQSEQANRQLKDALAEIDRAAIANYKGIANDYAARGMARSGGFMGAEAEAMAEKTRADQQTNQAVTDFLQQLSLQGTADLNTLETNKAKIMADFLARRFAGTQGGN